VHAIPERAPDVVLLDVRMPRLDGLGVLRGLASRGALPPTIVLTTFVDPEIVILKKGNRQATDRDRTGGTP